jgi:ABC-type multidrug transport system permease subunit
VGIFVLLGLTGIFFGMMFGVLNKDPERTIALLPMVLIPIIIFGGLIVSINEMPEYVQWLPYLSPLRHSFLIIFQDQLNTP